MRDPGKIRSLQFGVAAILGCVMLPAAAHGEHEKNFAQAQPKATATQNEEYVDKLIDGGELAPLVRGDEAGTASLKGHPRSVVVELGGSRVAPRSRIAGIDTRALDRVQQEFGVSVSGRYQTDNHGLLGIDADVRSGSQTRFFGNSSAKSTNGSVTVTDRNYPLGNGWLVDGGAGMISSTIIPMLLRQPRFYVPTSPLLGATVALKRYDRIANLLQSESFEPRFQLNLSVGEPGLVGGLRLGDFTGLSGVAATGGAQLNLSSHLAIGAQAIAVMNTRDPYSYVFPEASDGSPSGKISGQAALISASYSSGSLRVQANSILSSVSRSAGMGAANASNYGTSAGAWIDLSFRSGSKLHSGGLFVFGPKLFWGASPIVNDVYGGYYRLSASSQRWRWTFSADAVGSIDGRSTSGVILNADVRRQLTFNTGIGVNSTGRVANGHTWSQVLGYVDLSTKLGSSRAEAGWSHDIVSDLFHFGWNQNWALPSWLPQGSRLSTQLAFDHRSQPAGFARKLIGTTNSFGAAIGAGASPFNGINLDATIAYNSNASRSPGLVYGPFDVGGGTTGILSSQSGRAFAATIASTARLSPRWTLSVSYTDSRSNLYSRYGLSAPLYSPIGPTPADLATVSNSSIRLRAAYITLRYAISGGRPSTLSGQPKYPNSGTGILAGHVFLDGNENATREPSEAGAAGIIVILDGMAATKTDQSGAYRFDGVSEGEHRVTVLADALPLPWSIRSGQVGGFAGAYSAIVKIRLRSTTNLDIAASPR